MTLIRKKHRSKSYHTNEKRKNIVKKHNSIFDIFTIKSLLALFVMSIIGLLYLLLLKRRKNDEDKIF